MTKDKKTYTHTDFEKDNEVLNTSIINKLYVSYFNDECYHHKASYLYCSSDNSYGSIPPSLSDLYKKFTRNIILISDKSNDAYNYIEVDKSKLCIYLKYWLYDQIIKREVNQEDFTNFFNHWNEQKAKKCPDCKCEFPIKELSEIEQIKKIYDFFLFWDSYKDKKKLINEISDKEYCEYIDDSKILYNLYQTECEKDKYPLLCKEFKNYIIPHLNIDENFNIICKKEEEFDRSDWPDQDFGQSSSLSRPEDNDIVDQEEGEEDTEREPPPHISSSSSFSSTENVGQDLQHAHDKNALGVTDLLDPDSSNYGKSTGTIISASSVGTVGFLFLLYKFTPLRSMLDPRIRKTKNNLMNAVQGSNELQSQDYDFYSQDAHFNRYNIGYQSS